MLLVLFLVLISYPYVILLSNKFYKSYGFLESSRSCVLQFAPVLDDSDYNKSGDLFLLHRTIKNWHKILSEAKENKKNTESMLETRG